MKFLSTRDSKKRVDASFAIANGLSSDGGLYVPESFPKIDMSFIEEISQMEYYERASKIISLFLTDYDEKDILSYTKKAYEKFSGEAAPVVKIDEKLFVLELFHGPTCAFKDIALTLLPHLIVGAKNIQGIKEDIKILVATSGDTGKAALEGFKDVEHTSITVFYPSDGVSDIQKLQMQTQEGSNVKVYGVDGNFDNCQTAVKNVFASEKVKNRLKKSNTILSSANSINFGRLVPQIVYYISAYADILASKEIASGDNINFTVPTGNFGNILAAFYAKSMGLPIGKLICASNSNNVLTDFLNTGEYSTKRVFHKTMSPSMDILISSNLERLVFELCNRDSLVVQNLMSSLSSSGKYSISKDQLQKLSTDFFASFSDELQTIKTISKFFEEYGYALDPHTAVGVKSYYDYIKTKADDNVNVIVSTASPYKFAEDVIFAITKKEYNTAFDAIHALENETADEVPNSIFELKSKKIIHKDIILQKDLFDIV